MIVYLHGFNSTSQSKKAAFLSDYLAVRGWADQYACPDLPHWPAEAIAAIERTISTAKAAQPSRPITLLGSSLGGFYATYLAERLDLRAVLVNPAVSAERDLGKYLGPQQNLYSGERYVLTDAHLRQLEALVVPAITPARYLLVVETGDEVLDYRDAVTRYAGAQQVVVSGGDHTLQSFAQHLPRIFAFATMDVPITPTDRPLKYLDPN